MSPPRSIPVTPSAPAPITPAEQLNTLLRTSALDLFEAKGIDATTAEDIAQAAGISRRTFFRYFPVREDVLFSDHAAYLLQVEDRLRVNGGEPIRVAGAALSPLIEGLLADADFVARRSRLTRTSLPLRDREVLWLHEYQQLLGDYLTGQNLGARSAIFAQIVAAALLAALRQVIERWLDSPATENPRALFAELVDEIGESMGESGLRGEGPGALHPERPNAATPAPASGAVDRVAPASGVFVINSSLSAEEIAHLIEGAQK